MSTENWNKILKWTKNISKLISIYPNISVSTYTVINKINYKSLSELSVFLKILWFNNQEFAFIEYTNYALVNSDKISIRYSDILVEIIKLFKLSQKIQINLDLLNFPLCIFKGDLRQSMVSKIKPKNIKISKWINESFFEKNAKNEISISSKCLFCSYTDICCIVNNEKNEHWHEINKFNWEPGVKNYYSVFWDSEFESIK